MDPDVLRIAQVIAVLVMGIGSLTVIGVFAHRIVERTNRLRSQPPPSMADDRLQRIEQAVDAIAIEVERISEAQRFTTRLLTERKPDGQ